MINFPECVFSIEPEAARCCSLYTNHLSQISLLMIRKWDSVPGLSKRYHMWKSSVMRPSAELIVSWCNERSSPSSPVSLVVPTFDQRRVVLAFFTWGPTLCDTESIMSNTPSVVLCRRTFASELQNICRSSLFILGSCEFTHTHECSDMKTLIFNRSACQSGRVDLEG